MKKSSVCKRIFSLLLSACMLSTIHGSVPVMAEEAEQVDSARASVMQLMKTEGTVDISNGSGKNISLISNMKLYNGYHAETREASYAWINLDSEKLTKLDAVSEAEIRKNGKKLELLLESGNLFFNIKEDLQEDETLNVRTSTMVMGIRGTSGWVKCVDRWHSQVYILEGTVECHVTDPVTGQAKNITLSSGESADFYAYPQEQEGDKCDIITKKFTEDDIDGFALVELVEDAPLCEEIQEASGLDILSLADEAQQRLEDTEAEMRELMAQIKEKEAGQEHHISKDPVWKDGNTAGSSGVAAGDNQDGIFYPGQETAGIAQSGADNGNGSGASSVPGLSEEPVFIPVVSDEDSSSGSSSGSSSWDENWDYSGTTKPSNIVKINDYTGTYTNGSGADAGKITISANGGQSVLVRLEAYRTADDSDLSVVFEGAGYLVGGRLIIKISGQWAGFEKRADGSYILTMPETLKQELGILPGICENAYYPVKSAEEEKPGAAEEDPGTTEEDPGTTEKPGTTEEDPGITDEDPKPPEEEPQPEETVRQAYQKILDEYIKSCGITPEEYTNPSLDSSIMADYYRGNISEIYYTYCDVDGNGTEEMLIGIEMDGTIRGAALYTYDTTNQKAALGCNMPKNGFLAIMTNGTILKDGTDPLYRYEILKDGYSVNEESSVDLGNGNYLLKKVNQYKTENGLQEIEYDWKALNIPVNEDVRIKNPLSQLLPERKLEDILTTAFKEKAKNSGFYYIDTEGSQYRVKATSEPNTLRIQTDKSRIISAVLETKITIEIPFEVDMDGSWQFQGDVAASYEKGTGYFRISVEGDINECFIATIDQSLFETKQPSCVGSNFLARYVYDSTVGTYIDGYSLLRKGSYISDTNVRLEMVTNPMADDGTYMIISRSNSNAVRYEIRRGNLYAYINGKEGDLLSLTPLDGKRIRIESTGKDAGLDDLCGIYTLENS